MTVIVQVPGDFGFFDLHTSFASPTGRTSRTRVDMLTHWHHLSFFAYSPTTSTFGDMLGGSLSRTNDARGTLYTDMPLICRPARVPPNVITFCRRCTRSVIPSGYPGHESSLYGPPVIADEVEWDVKQVSHLYSVASNEN
jgi:hypothetical protein